MKFNNKWLILILALAATQNAIAQTGAGSSSVENTTLTVSSGNSISIYSESLYIGPDAVWNIDGTVVIYSKNIWIAPTAQILQNGVGSIIFEDPDNNPFYPDMPAGFTTIDANNGNAIGHQMVNMNPNNIVLGDISDPGYSTTNPSGALSAALNISNNFALDAAGGDIILNGNDLKMINVASITGASVDRKVVTGNSIAGHLVWESQAAGSAKDFPIAISETVGDFSPAHITSSGTGAYHVSVTDYTASGIIINGPEEGMDRVWHIYGDLGAQNITLQNDVSTNGTSYNDVDAFITRYLGAGVWSTGTPEQIASGVHYNDGATAAGIPASATADGAWLTKTSDAISPLPIKLLSFEAYQKGGVADLVWVTASEQNNKGFEIESSMDGRNWAKIGFVNSQSGNGNSNVKLDYTFTDNEPENGQNFYRLKQSDFDGKYEYSPVRMVIFDKANIINIYPNPTSDAVRIQGLLGNEQIEVYDINGRMVAKLNANSGIMTVSLDNLSNGTYHISIIDIKGSITSHKIVKK